MLICETAAELHRRAADEIASLIRRHASVGRDGVLGLATGNTVVGVYRELVDRHRASEVSFAQVTTFNLDEYHPMAPESEKSYHHYMQAHLFDHVDVDRAKTHVPDGTASGAEIDRTCARYEEAILAAGGIDLQVVGIGRTGHIGFNEPGSSADSRTRLVTLAPTTRQDAASAFGGLESVPHHAISMGIATILSARRILLLATGDHKGAIVARALTGPVDPEVPASFLQRHPNVHVLLDRPAARHLAMRSDA